MDKASKLPDKPGVYVIENMHNGIDVNDLFCPPDDWRDLSGRDQVAWLAKNTSLSTRAIRRVVGMCYNSVVFIVRENRKVD